MLECKGRGVLEWFNCWGVGWSVAVGGCCNVRGLVWILLGYLRVECWGEGCWSMLWCCILVGYWGRVYVYWAIGVEGF